MKKIYLFSFCLSLFLSSNSQTIPCPGFENWVNSNESGSNYLIPQGWISFDQFTNAFNASYTGISAIRTTSKNAGQYAALLQTAIMGNDTVNGGLITCASLNTFFSVIFGGTEAFGFPYTTRSANLQGYYKLTRVGGDSAFMLVVMTKWNTSQQKRDTLSMTEYSFLNNPSSYTPFTIPLTYSLNLFPDTAAILTAIDGPNGQKSHVGTQFYLDDLIFSGTVPVGISETLMENNFVRIYPNPFTSQATIELTTAMSLNDAKVIICDALGNEVRTLNNFTGYTMSIEKDELQSGLYFYRLLDAGEIISGGKFIIE